MNLSTNLGGQKPTPKPDGKYDDYLRRIQANFNYNVSLNKRLFRTGVADLFEVFLGALPEEERQYHNCHCCRNFINNYGGLVLINDDGTLTSAVWEEDDAEEPYLSAVRAMLKVITKAKVEGVFLSPVSLVGTPRTGPWTHYHLGLPAVLVHQRGAKHAHEVVAEKLEEFRMVQRALAEITIKDAETMVAILDADELNRSEKFMGPAKWILKGKQIMSDKGTKTENSKRNRLWKHLANAPAGYAHIRSGMLGTLLTDIQAGLPMATIKKNFNDKMHPLRYQRPTAPPTEGNIAQAEKLVEKLGIKNSLRRRMAHMDEIQTFWKEDPVAKEDPNGVFGHLRQRAQERTLVADTKLITMEKFVEKVLPTAREIFVNLPNRRCPMVTLTSAADPTAPLIFHWNNPVAWYLHVHGSNPADWGVSGFTRVKALCRQPNEWEGFADFVGNGVVFILEDAKEKKPEVGVGLFPTFLKKDLHEIRSTIEAYSNKARLEPTDQPVAAGLIIQKSNTELGYGFEVNDGTNVRKLYRIDRWE